MRAPGKVETAGKAASFGIGTAQFGMNYGVSNTRGQTSEGEAEEILRTAAESGVRVLDTAALYGASEEVLGRLLPARHAFAITTKLPNLLSPDGVFDRDAADRLLASSLRRLRQPRVYGLMLHRPDELYGPEGEAIMAWLLRCREQGLAERIGVSVYAEDDLPALLARYPIGIVQAPVSLLDQRLLRSGALSACKAQGAEVHVRSVFLQGLLLMEPADLPPYFAEFDEALGTYRAFLERHALRSVEAALDFALHLEEADAVVCGVNDRAQLCELLGFAGRAPRRLNYERLAADDPRLLNPSQWQIHS
ncbi:aldo/keto reductase [Cohnella nanjingensis]|uniref:Aldo/keto reductase n=1 Tax=Cohnella nanjingensis TaxID=1387779 RepID=A0A7X0RSQ0_9BACL|nr:aldo/keto reductase [Cohnella nanjingensis]MBB6671700.1 aldo/keto reductase [Cohnella nanjingensis]